MLRKLMTTVCCAVFLVTTTACTLTPDGPPDSDEPTKTPNKAADVKK